MTTSCSCWCIRVSPKFNHNSCHLGLGHFDPRDERPPVITHVCIVYAEKEKTGLADAVSVVIAAN